jgi:hypothetical protein
LHSSLNVSKFFVLFEFLFFDLIQSLTQILDFETLLVNLNLSRLRLDLHLFKFNSGVSILLLELAIEKTVCFNFFGELHNPDVHLVQHTFNAVTMKIGTTNLLIADEMKHKSQDVSPFLLVSGRGRNKIKVE